MHSSWKSAVVLAVVAGAACKPLPDNSSSAVADAGVVADARPVADAGAVADARPIDNSDAAGSVDDACSPPAGFVCPTGSPWAARYGLTAAEFESALGTLGGQGFRLSHVSGSSSNGQARYAAIWEKCESPPWEVRYGLTTAEYQMALDSFAASGYRLTDASGYEVGGVAYYAGVWEQREGAAWQARYGVTSAELQRALDELSGQGYRLSLVNGYSLGGPARYTAIWERCATTDWQARYGLSAAEFQTALDGLVSQGFRVVHVSGYGVAGQQRYAAVFDKSAGPAWDLRYGLSSDEFQQALDSFASMGYRVADVAGYAGRFAALWTADGAGL
jgi:hypothetical protein